MHARGPAHQVSVTGLAVVCLNAGARSLDELTDDDITACTRVLAEAPSLTATILGHNTARVFSLHHACYQLRICHQPPRMARQPAATIEQALTGGIPQPQIREVGIASAGVSLVLAGMGGAKRHEQQPWIPLLLLGKSLADAAGGSFLFAEQLTKHKRLCSWCTASAGLMLATVPAVLPEAWAAWKAWRR